MTIKFSRHAKRRAQLYKIQESLIEKIIRDSNLCDGKHDLIREVPGFKFPLKVVVSVESGRITVITNYPLKKGQNP